MLSTDKLRLEKVYMTMHNYQVLLSNWYQGWGRCICVEVTQPTLAS